RAGRCENEMLDSVVPAAFQDVLKSENVRVDVCVWVDDRVAHPGLRREMNDACGTVFTEELLHRVGIGDVNVCERERVMILELRETRFLQVGIVIGVEIVETDDAFAALEQPFGN